MDVPFGLLSCVHGTQQPLAFQCNATVICLTMYGPGYEAPRGVLHVGWCTARRVVYGAFAGVRCVSPFIGFAEPFLANPGIASKRQNGARPIGIGIELAKCELPYHSTQPQAQAQAQTQAQKQVQAQVPKDLGQRNRFATQRDIP